MKRFFILSTIFISLASCFGPSGVKDITVTEEPKCTDSIRVLNIITETLKIGRCEIFNIDDETRASRFIMVSRYNLPYEFADFHADSLPAVKFLPADTLNLIEDHVVFEELEIANDTAYVRFAFLPGHWGIAGKFYVNECEPILLECCRVHMNRMGFITPEGKEETVIVSASYHPVRRR